MSEPPELRVGDPFDAADGGTNVPIEEGDSRQSDRAAAADLERAQRDPGGREVRDIGALTVACVAAHRPVGATKRPMVDRDQVREAPCLESAHARIRLVDRVPAETLLDAADRREALSRVQLE